jgi:monofunctional biosynthetic peptidoglycan transglycosylase
VKPTSNPHAQRGPKRRSKRGSKSRSRRPRHWILRILLAGILLVVFLTAAPIALLRFVPPPTTAFMWQSYAADPATGRACPRVAYDWIAWPHIAKELPRAILVAEDQRFFEHRGFDTKAIGTAVDDFVAGGRLRGASTATQQVAKNLFLWPGRSLLRKGLEAWLTLWIESLWPKQRILEVHLNIAQFGPCVFGVEAASRRFYGIGASRVSARQAARLAAVLPAPGRMRVDDPGPFTERRTEEILTEMRRGGGPMYLNALRH